MWHAALDTIADSVNPILALVAIVAMLRERRRPAFIAATLAGVADIYLVQAIDARFSIWRGWGGDYSTHTAFATTLGISLAFAFRRRVLLAAVLLVYFALMLVMRYHSAADIATSSAVAAAVTLPWHVGLRAGRQLGSPPRRDQKM